jgi:hypothetical protein
MLGAFDVLGFEAFIALDDLELDLFALVQGFEALAEDGRVMDEDVLPGFFDDEAEAFLIIKPLDLATGHSCLLMCLAQMKRGCGMAPASERTPLKQRATACA